MTGRLMIQLATKRSSGDMSGRHITCISRWLVYYYYWFAFAASTSLKFMTWFMKEY